MIVTLLVSSNETQKRHSHRIKITYHFCIERVHLDVCRTCGMANNEIFTQCCCGLFCVSYVLCYHYCDVIMGAISSQITSLTIVYSTVYSDADQRKHQSSLTLVRGIHRWPVNSPHKWPVTGKGFHLMTSSCILQGCFTTSGAGKVKLEIMSKIDPYKKHIKGRIVWNYSCMCCF